MVVASVWCVARERGHRAPPAAIQPHSPPRLPPQVLKNPSVPFQKTYPIGRDKNITINISGDPVAVKGKPRGGPVTRAKATHE